MSGDEGSFRGIQASLSLITRRLDELAAALAKLKPAVPPPSPVGEPLDEPTRARIAVLQSLLAIAPDLPREDALRLAVDRAIHHAGADCAALFLPTESGELRAVAQRGFPPAPPRLAADQGIVGRAFLEDETVRAAPAHRAADPLMHEHTLDHALAVPVREPGEGAIGVLFAGRRRRGPFGDEALETLLLVADRVAACLVDEPGRLGARGAAAAFAADLDLGRVSAAVAEAVVARLGASSAAVLLPTEAGVRVAGGAGLAPDVRLNAPLDAESSAALANALRSRRGPVVTPEAEGFARLLTGTPRLVVPLAVGGEVVAVVVAGGPEPLDAGAVEDVLVPAAVALRNARLYDEASRALAEVQAGAERSPGPAPRPVRDFASLLAVILSRVGLAKDRVADPAARADLEVTEEAAWRAAEAMQEVLGLTPARRGDPLPPVDLAVVIRAAVEGAVQRWIVEGGRAPSVEVKLDLLPPAHVSAGELRDALERILDNGAEAVATGGAITVRARWIPEEGVEVTIEDPGAGMEEAVRLRATAPFFSTKGPGRLGLGLAVAESVVTRHGGRLTLASAPGEGTSVRLLLPITGPRRSL